MLLSCSPEGPVWNFATIDYRSVPEPRRIWVGTHSEHISRLEVDDKECLHNPVEYIELTDSVKHKLGIKG